ncbi:MAG: NADH-quinone oxidoreductase subunit C [Chloroflexota bacterium]|nr:MAG: NADH-quinone oxidoreductase subunit C [Chloroflexota bacterium]
MRTELRPEDVAKTIQSKFPGAVQAASGDGVVVKRDALLSVARFLKEDPSLALNYLSAVTGVDRTDYFEVVYHLASIQHSHGLVIKTQAPGREKPTVPSVTSIWRSADLQEREVYDLMGVHFEGHPNLRRILLWDEYEGHPLRKDFDQVDQWPPGFPTEG